LSIAYPPFDFLIVFGVTFLSGLTLKKSLFKTNILTKKIEKFFPYAICYLIVSLLFAFIIDELPVKFYGLIETVYDPSNNLGSQSISKDGMIILVLYTLSVAFNFLLWIFCLVVIIIYIYRTTSNKYKNAEKN
jgi:hypothetical protein